MKFDDRVKEELQVIQKLFEQGKKAIDYLGQGQIEEFHEAVDSLYLESNKSEARNVNTFAEKIILHLFKLAYGNDTNSHKHLSDEIDEFRDSIIRLTNWDEPKKRVKIVIQMAEENMYLSYRRAVKTFQRILENNPKDYKIQSTRNFSKECPWTLEQLMDDTLDELVKTIDDNDDILNPPIYD